MIPVGVLGVILLVVLIRLGVGSMDRSRIEEYVNDRGGRVVSITWAPFGPGWFGEKNDRIYEVVTYDADGRQHFAAAKTSMWSGVYWTEDQVTHDRPDWYDRVPEGNPPGHPLIGEIGRAREDADAPEDEVARLREENARLRDELERRGP